MLCLGRKKGQKVIIAGNIEVMIVDIRGDKIRLGISAPPDVPIMRAELLEAKEPCTNQSPTT